MKKKVLQLIGLALCCALVMSFFGCAPKKEIKEVDETDLYISILQRGYGTAWVQEMKTAFEAKNEGITVHITETTQREVLQNSFGSGKGFNDEDIYFDLYPSFYKLENSYQNFFPGYEKGFYDLTGIYKKEIPGEGVTMEDKMFPYMRDNYAFSSGEDTKYYFMPWATAPMGLYYNANVLRAALGNDYDLPNTTNELRTLAADIKAGGKVPFTYPGQLNQWHSILYTWWAQYGGLEEYRLFYEGKVYDEISDSYIVSKDIYNQTGRKKALEELGYLLDAENGFHDADVNDYGATNFRVLQARFVNAEQPYAMYPCGDWLAQESATAMTAEVKMMKTPVLSSIIDRLDSVNDDATLSAVIDYVDQTSAVKPQGVTDANIEEVRIARNMVYTLSQQHFSYVPVYTNAATLVEKFLLFMASDEGLQIYKKNVSGGFLPFTYDYSGSGLSDFENSIAKIIENPVVLTDVSASPLFVKGNIEPFGLTLGTMDTVLGASKTSAVYMSAETAFKKMKYSDSAWAQVISNSGM